MKKDSDSRKQAPPSKETLWEFVALADHRVPPTPTVSAAQHRWVSLKRLFGRRNNETKAPAVAAAQLQGLPVEQLDALVGPLDREAGAEALQRAFEEAEDRRAVRFLVGPPHGGHAELLESWASRQGARRIDEPSFEEILAGGGAWLSRWPEHSRPWVLPRLEKCWLRHPAGLALARSLMARAMTADVGCGVIGCDSWTWAYLGLIAPRPVAGVLTLQAFDSARLAALFRSLSSVDPKRSVHFRDARTGKRILSVPADDNEDDDDGSDLQNLAAYARGNPGIARALWRGRLRAHPESESEEDPAGSDTPESHREDADVVWVSPLRDAPELPDGRHDDIALVLHALLLHGGLPTAMLGSLVPLPRFRVEAILPRLQAAEIIERDRAGCWRVTAFGYAPARGFLKERGFLTDAL